MFFAVTGEGTRKETRRQGSDTNGAIQEKGRGKNISGHYKAVEGILGGQGRRGGKPRKNFKGMSQKTPQTIRGRARQFVAKTFVEVGE